MFRTFFFHSMTTLKFGGFEVGYFHLKLWLSNPETFLNVCKLWDPFFIFPVDAGYKWRSCGSIARITLKTTLKSWGWWKIVGGIENYFQKKKTSSVVPYCVSNTRKFRAFSFIAILRCCLVNAIVWLKTWFVLHLWLLDSCICFGNFLHITPNCVIL